MLNTIYSTIQIIRKMSAPTQKNSTLNSIKAYLFPSILSILAMMIWNDVTELKSDVKALLSQSSIDKTEIENIKKDIDMLNSAVFKHGHANLNSSDSNDLSFLYYRDKYFKHEEMFDIKKYLN